MKYRYWKDEWNMILEGDDSNTWRDSIGRNFDAYIATGCVEEDLVEAVWSCFSGKKSVNSSIECLEPRRWQRHPKYFGEQYRDLSRDHITYALLLFIIADREDYFNAILDNIKWRINKHTSMRGMWLWTKALRSERWTVVYHIFKIIGIPFKRLVNHIVRYEADINPERSQDEWDLDLTRNRTTKQRLAPKWIAMPAYTLHSGSWQLHVLPDSWLRSIHQKLLLPLVGKHNYVIKLLLGQKLTEEESKLALEYRSMTGSRWTTTLDELNDRHVEEVNPEELGEYDIDAGYIKYLVKELN